MIKTAVFCLVLLASPAYAMQPIGSDATLRHIRLKGEPRDQDPELTALERDVLNNVKAICKVEKQRYAICREEKR